MFKAIAFGLGVGAGVQAWRAWPPDASVGPEPLAFVFCLGLVLAYFAGRWSSRGATATATATATAVAESTAVASNQVNVAVVVPGAGAGSVPRAVQIPSESAPWFASTATTPELSVDQLEGLDFSELVESGEYDEQHG